MKDARDAGGPRGCRVAASAPVIRFGGSAMNSESDSKRPSVSAKERSRPDGLGILEADHTAGLDRALRRERDLDVAGHELSPVESEITGRPGEGEPWAVAGTPSRAGPPPSA